MKDNLGIFCSTLCIIHCTLIPILAAMGIFGALSMALESPLIHAFLLIPVIFLAVSSLPKSKKVHGSLTPSLFAVLGIALMIITFFMPEEVELWLMLFAGLFVITAHLLNKYLLMSNTLLISQ